MPDARRAIALGFGLAALGNLIGLMEPCREPPVGWSTSGTLLYARSLLYALWPTTDSTGPPRWRRDDVLRRLAEAGVTGHNLKRSLAAGALVGLVLGSPGLVLPALPENWLPAVRRAQRMTPLAAARFVFGQLLVSIAASEELAFRGVLQRKLRTSFRPRDAVLLSSLFFALWHGVFNARTLAATGVTGKLRLSLASVVQMLSVYVGGLAFGLLRERSGNLAGAIVAHWLTDVLLNTRFLMRVPN